MRNGCWFRIAGATPEEKEEEEEAFLCNLLAVASIAVAPLPSIQLHGKRVAIKPGERICRALN